jgi:hypothetical protein
MEKKERFIEPRYWLKFDKEEFNREYYRITGHLLSTIDFEDLIKECRSKNLLFIIDFPFRELIIQKINV